MTVVFVQTFERGLNKQKGVGDFLKCLVKQWNVYSGDKSSEISLMVKYFLYLVGRNILKVPTLKSLIVGGIIMKKGDIVLM